MSITVRPMTHDDVGDVVRVHLSAFPNFFLSFLGNKFLRELYLGILDDPSGIAFVSETDKQIGGFVAGTDSPTGLYMRLLKRRWWRFGIACAGKAVRHPHIIPRLLRAFSMPSSRHQDSTSGLLMSLAVRPDIQGNGSGRALVDAFLLAANRRELQSVALTTDSDNNENVNRFYRRLGFELAGTYVTPEGRRMNEYRIRLNNGKTPATQEPAVEARPRATQGSTATHLEVD